MSEIRGCSVRLDDGNVRLDVGVLFKESGFVRVRDEHERVWYPRERIKFIKKPEETDE